MNNTKPTDLELAKALWEVSIYVGQLPTKSEKRTINAVIDDLIRKVITAHNLSFEQEQDFRDKNGPISLAAKKALKAHFNRS